MIEGDGSACGREHGKGGSRHRTNRDIERLGRRTPDARVEQWIDLTTRASSPVSAPTRTVPAAPTFAVGTANAPALAKTTRPGNVLAARAMMSGPGVLVAESVIVFTPGMVNAGMTPSHAEPGIRRRQPTRPRAGSGWRRA